jgi:hypothetical protein
MRPMAGPSPRVGWQLYGVGSGDLRGYLAQFPMGHKRRYSRSLIVLRHERMLVDSFFSI